MSSGNVHSNGEVKDCCEQPNVDPIPAAKQEVKRRWDRRRSAPAAPTEHPRAEVFHLEFPPDNSACCSALRDCSRNDFYFKGIVGTGNFGRVSHQVHKVTDESYAVKTILKKKVVNRGVQEHLQREVNTQCRFRHPNIIKLHTFYQDHTSVSLVLEYADQGTLREHLVSQRQMNSETQAAQFFRDIALALHYLHENDIAHRDVKPENILLCTGDAGLVAKLADFGLCAELSDGKHDTYCGTDDYLAPEMIFLSIAGGKHDHRVDVWAAGIVLFEMMCREVPFKAKSLPVKYEQILAVNLFFPRWVSEGAKQLVHALLKVNPFDRLSMDAALKHNWLESHIGFVTASNYPSSPAGSQKISKSDEDEESGSFHCVPLMMTPPQSPRAKKDGHCNDGTPLSLMMTPPQSPRVKEDQDGTEKTRKVSLARASINPLASVLARVPSPTKLRSKPDEPVSSPKRQTPRDNVPWHLHPLSAKLSKMCSPHRLERASSAQDVSLSIADTIKISIAFTAGQRERTDDSLQARDARRRRSVA